MLWTSLSIVNPRIAFLRFAWLFGLLGYSFLFNLLISEFESVASRALFAVVSSPLLGVVACPRFALRREVSVLLKNEVSFGGNFSSQGLRKFP